MENTEEHSDTSLYSTVHSLRSPCVFVVQIKHTLTHTHTHGTFIKKTTYSSNSSQRADILK